jgi:hypothetical protein
MLIRHLAIGFMMPAHYSATEIVYRAIERYQEKLKQIEENKK